MLSYTECLQITNESNVFVERQTNVDGYDIRIFNYMLAQYSDFNQYNAFEMRGLTFVKNGNSYDRWLMLPKFFNVNEIENNKVDYLREKKIVKVYDKLDGSLVQPILLPNGSIRFKTKQSFDNKQAKTCNDIAKQKGLYENEHFNTLLKNGYNLLFEYISPFNQIVIDYEQIDIVLLCVRDKDGNFVDHVDIANKIGVNTPYEYPVNDIDYYLQLAKTEKEKEGWIIWFDDGSIVKLKTDWYVALHGTISELSVSKIANLALNDELDDVKLFTSGEKLKSINELERVVFDKFNTYVKDVIKYSNILSEMDRKEFVMTYKNELGDKFPIVMRLNGNSDPDDVENVVKQYFSKVFIKEERSKKFLQYSF